VNRRQFVARSLDAAAVTLLAGCHSPAESPPRRRMLVVTETEGFHHDSIPAAVDAVRTLGREDGWEIVGEAATAREVAAAVTAERLAGVDGVCFASTTGTLGFTADGRRAFHDWVARGGGFVGIHSASDTFHDDPDYLALLGGEFRAHGPQVRVEAVVQDAAHPACAALPPTFEIFDEIYEFQRWERSRVHTLLALRRHPQTGAPGDFPLAWTRRSGLGRVFYTALGHREDVYADARYRAHLRGGIRWTLGLAAGDDTTGNPAV
jgi:type 1 glutamine amidotransferase